MKTVVFVTLVCFWTLMAIFSNMFDVVLSETEITDYIANTDDINTQDTGFKKLISDVFDVIEDIPVLKYFVPLFKIMSFQYSDQVPATVSIFLDSTLIITAFIFLSVIRKS